MIPPPKTPDEDQLIDFTMMMNVPPPGFSDDGSSVGSHQDDIPASVADLPAPIREHLDAYVHSEEDLGGQLAAIDALMLSEYYKHIHFFYKLCTSFYNYKPGVLNQ